jgi:SAM-dependent methyltransferase
MEAAPVTNPAAAPPAVAPRVALLRSMFDNDGVGLEIGPLHSPVAAKRDGFRVEILDHASTAELRAKYRDDPHVDTGSIEEVDYVSDGRPLREVVGPGRSYDWIIASHVIEHLTDPIGFLSDCEALLRPGGRLVLAVPDRRKCFDALRPVSTLGAMLEAHAERRSRHRLGALFDSAAYSARLAGSHAWSDYDSGAPDLAGTPEEGLLLFEAGRTSADYADVHGWVFTPASFRLILSDLLALGRTGLREVSFAGSPGCEFFVSLAADGAGCPVGRHDLALAVLTEAGQGVRPTEAERQAAALQAELQQALQEVARCTEQAAALRAELHATRRDASSQAEQASGLQAELHAARRDAASQAAQASELRAALHAARQDAACRAEQVAALQASTSWRITAPLRGLGRSLGRRR